MDYEALYAHRFKNVDQADRARVWGQISRYIMTLAGNPERVLDPACGLGEFISSCGAPERWAVDLGTSPLALSNDVRFTSGSFFDVDLPVAHFDMVFASNVLEHMPDQHHVNRFLVRAKSLLRPGGRVVVVGPNFKFCANEYFDCADHMVPLTHVSIEEHLAAAGYSIERSVPRFLPYSFRSRLPASRLTTRAYLSIPIAWRILGKQFLVIGVNPTE